MTARRGQTWPSLEQVTLIVTEACNLSCSYCVQSRSTARMDASTARAGVDLLWRWGRGPAAVAFFGGEPLLEADLVCETIDHARRSFDGSGRTLRLFITTNGSLLDEELFVWLGRRGVEITLSIDGPVEVQTQRSVRSVAGVLRVLYWQRRHGLSGLTTHSVVSPANVSTLSRSIRFLVEAGVEDIRLAPDSTVAWPPEATRELERQLRHAAAYLRTLDRNPVRTFERRRPELRPFRCRAGHGSIAVSASGTIFACHLQDPMNGLQGKWPDDVRYGPVDAFEPSRYGAWLQRLRAHQVFWPQDRRRTPTESCADCRYLHFCWLCPGQSLRTGGDDPLLVPQYLCDRLKVMHRLTARVQLLDGNRPSALGRLMAAGR